MLTRTWHRKVATLLTAGVLMAAASAQNGSGAREDVTVRPKNPSITTVNLGVDPMVKPKIVERDPFINKLHNDNGRTRVEPKTRVLPTPTATNKENTPTPVRSVETKAPEIVAPQVTVNGIITSGAGRQAIISTGVGTRTVTKGQKLGDYRVAAIGPDYVTFGYGESKLFKVSLDSEFK